MIPPKHLEYYMTEWVAASLEAIVAHRLFPSIGAPSSRRVNVLRPTQISEELLPPARSSAGDSSTYVWDATTPDEAESNGGTSTQCPNDEARSACHFSAGFTPESARHFQVEVPQIESLRAALLSDPKFEMQSPWQLRVVIVLHVVPVHQGAARSVAFSVRAHEAKSAGVGPVETELNALRDPRVGPTWRCGTTGDPSLSDASGVGETHKRVSPRVALPRIIDSQTHFFLEQWVLSFHPSTALDRQAKFEHRKLCTSLKGLMAAIHFLPTHSALLALANAEKTYGNRVERGVAQTQQNTYVETHICARWQGHESKVRHGQATPAPWTPIASYISDMEGALTCKSLDALGAATGDTHKPVAGSCGKPVRCSPTPYAPAQFQNTPTPGTARGHAAARRASLASHWRWMCAAGRGGLGISDMGAYPPGSPAPHRLGSILPCRSRHKYRVSPTPGDSGAPSLLGLSCRSSGEGYAASSVTRLDASETRTLLSLTTSLGSLECTVTYNEDVAQSIVAARELDAIDGCIEDFHPIADSFLERGITDCLQDGGTVVSDSDPWLDMDDPYGCVDPVLPHRQHQLALDIELSLGTPSESVSSPRDRSCPSKESWGIWRSLLKRSSIKRAYSFASIPMYGLGLGPLLDRYPTRALLKLPAAAAAAAGARKGGGEAEHGTAWAPCSFPSARLDDIASPWSPRHDSMGCCSYVFCADGGDTAPAIFHMCPTIRRALGEGLMPDRSDELGETLRAEEGVLLDDNEFGSMWLNSASSFSLAHGTSLHSASTDRQGVRRVRHPAATDVSSVLQRIDEALASEEAFPALDAMKYLSDSLNALERCARQLLPSTDPRWDEPQNPNEAEKGVAETAVRAPSPPEPGPTDIRRHWRYVSLCAAAVGAQQEEERALRELCFAELDPTLVPSQCEVQLDDMQVVDGGTLSVHKQAAVPGCHRHAAGKPRSQHEKQTTC